MTRELKSSPALSRRDLIAGRIRPPSLSSVVRISALCLSVKGITCRSCEDACDQRAIRFRPERGGRAHPRVDAERCTACGDCLPVCPVSALTLDEVQVDV